MPAADLPKLIFLPGIGADHRLFHEQLKEFPDARAVDFIRHQQGESTAEYAKRWAGEWLTEPSVVIGFSFGGMLALELLADPQLSRKIKAIGLISSCRSKESIDYFRARGRFAAKLPTPILKLGLELSRRRFTKTELLSSEHAHLLKDQQAGVDYELLRWSVLQCAEWQGPGPSIAGNTPILQIHGRHDDTILPYPGDPTHWIESGRHLIQYTHPDQIAGFIRDCLQLASKPRAEA